MLSISFRYLFSKKYKYLPSFGVFLAFFGVFLSVATLILVLSVMNGFKSDFEKLIIGTRPHVTLYPSKTVFADISTKTNALNTNLNISSTHPTANGEGVVSFNDKTSGVIIKGVTTRYFQSRDLLKQSIVKGKFKEGHATIGIELAQKLGIKIGDNITILSSKMRRTIFGSLPIHKTYTVSGYFKVNMHIYDSTAVYLHIKDAGNLLFNIQGEGMLANALEITLIDANKTEDVYRQLGNLPTFSDNYITNWKTDNQSFIDAIATQTAVMFLILSLFLIISAFIIFSTITSIVNEKRRSVAILQSFGMRGGSIVQIFFAFGAIITLPAIFFGAVVGSMLSLKIDDIKNWLETQTGSVIFDSAYYFLSYIPSTVHWESVWKICLFSFILCMISTILPSIRSCKVLPHESLRFE
ncbi:MAG: lipoprotein-releasing system permease protein [Candidatus Deianiraeaceae bacterium]|jgi:lipoprotein-releasing system permease protein